MHYALKLVYILPVVFLAIMIINRLLLRYNSKLVTPIVTKGDKVQLEINIKNNSLFISGEIRTYIEVYYGNCLRRKYSVNCMVMPFSKYTHTIEMTAEYSGNMTIIRKKVKMWDYFKLFAVPIARRNRVDSVVVMPKINTLDVELLDHNNLDLIETDKYHASKKGNDKSEIFDVREYTEGDQIGDVHWKLTLKYDKYIIKEYSLPITTDLEIVFDCAWSGIDMEKVVYKDKLLEILYSVASDLLSKEINFYIVTRSGNGENVERILVENEDTLYETVVYSMGTKAKSKKNAKNDGKNLISLVEKKNLLIITDKLTEDMVNEIEVNHYNKRIVLMNVYNSEQKTDEKVKIPEFVKVIKVDINTTGLGEIYEIRFE